MPIIKVDRVLRQERGGASTSIIAKAGAKVEILDATSLPWTKIRLVEEAEQPEGWIAATAIDSKADSLGPLDKSLVAARCVTEGYKYGISPYYLMAIAALRTDITDLEPLEDDGFGRGLFAFTSKEWSANLVHDDYSINFQEHEIAKWRSQVTMAAILASEILRNLTDKQKRSPNFAELYFAQLLGVDAAVDAFSESGKTIGDIVSEIKATSPSNSQDIAAYSKRDLWALKETLTVAESIKLIENKLAPALDDVRVFLKQEVETFIAHLQEVQTISAKEVGKINFASDDIIAGRRHMAELIAQKFAEAGYGTIQQIAAIANAIAESALDPDAINEQGEKSYGLFQLNQDGGVGTGYTKSHLIVPENNIAIMLKEIQTQHGNRQKFLAANNLREAVEIFTVHFEKPANARKKVIDRFRIAEKLVARAQTYSENAAVY